MGRRRNSTGNRGGTHSQGLVHGPARNVVENVNVDVDLNVRLMIGEPMVLWARQHRLHVVLLQQFGEEGVEAQLRQIPDVGNGLIM